MNIDELTIGQAKEIAAIFGGGHTQIVDAKVGLNSMIGKKVIIRTYSAGVWYGTLSEKCGNEVIITDARRMWRWWAAESISLSAVAAYGIKHDKSKIAVPVSSVWLEAIELIPCREIAIKSIASATNVIASD